MPKNTMKRYFLITVTLVSILFSSCDKDGSEPDTGKVERTIQYVLYTNEDFSNDEHNITFSVFARDDERTLLDSALTTMKVKEVPSAANKIVIEKKIVTDPSTVLVAGFVYKIEGVGTSWYLDS